MDSEEVRRVENFVARFFDSIIKRIREKCERVNSFLQRERKIPCKYENLRNFLLRKSKIDTEVTGSTAYAMLRELEEQARAPPNQIFALAVQEMENQGKHIEKRLNEILSELDPVFKKSEIAKIVNP